MLRADGGASANDLLLQLQADLLQVTDCAPAAVQFRNYAHFGNWWSTHVQSALGCVDEQLGRWDVIAANGLCRCRCTGLRTRRRPRWALHMLLVRGGGFSVSDNALPGLAARFPQWP